MSWTVVNADQLSNYYKQQQTAQNPYAAYYNQYNNQAANSQTPQIIQLPVSPHPIALITLRQFSAQKQAIEVWQ